MTFGVGKSERNECRSCQPAGHRCRHGRQLAAATVMSLLFTPVFYVMLQRLSGLRKKKPQKEPKIAADAKPALLK
jgi:hypothetical protein